MSEKLKLPMGIENFEEMRTEGYYYIDKTRFIHILLNNIGKVNLFTRPRRFGKTLNMSMLKYFFEAGSDSTLFDGLAISTEKKIFDEYMGKFPVVSISLKGVSGTNFGEAKGMLRGIIGNEALRFESLLQNNCLSETEYQRYKKMISLDDKGTFAMPDELLKDSLLLLSRILHKHYKQKVIMLIDEYDVPLDRAYRSGYYDEMVEFIRGLVGQGVLRNVKLEF